MRQRSFGLIFGVLSTLACGCGVAYTPPAVIAIGASLPTGSISVAYSTALTATGGKAPYTWILSTGTLPAGVTLSAAGVISGMPTASGSSSFTVKATDSEVVPRNAAATLEIAIGGGPLSISTTSLPQGTQGVAYSTQLKATGGLAPYTWSLGPAAALARGVSLSSTGLVSGTPSGVSDSTTVFTVLDSTGLEASQTLSLVIQPPPAVMADGAYVFLFGGTSPQGTPIAPGSITINGTFTLKSGAVVSGYFDANTNSSPALVEQPIAGGSLTAYANGLGRLVLKSGNGGSISFALAIPPSSAPGKPADIRMIEFDDADGSGTRGSGVLKPSSPAVNLEAITGNFAFLVSGADVDQNPQALIGSFQTDGAGNIVGGLADANSAGQLLAFPLVNGTYSVDGNGRGTFQFVLGPGPIADNSLFHFSFYQVSPGEWLTISLDPATLNSPLVGGMVLQQQAAAFSAASLPAVSVFAISGIAATAAGSIPDITVGLTTSDGNGNLSFNFDEYSGTLMPNQSHTATYTVDPLTGRTPTTASGPGPILYLVDAAHAFILDSDSSSSAGLLEAQSGSPFTNASFNGNYLGGSLPLMDNSVLNESGIVAADGNGTLLLTTDRSSPQGLTLFENVAGTYAVDNTGRVVATTPDGETRIFYIVSPVKAAYLTTDGGGYLGIFEQ